MQPYQPRKTASLITALGTILMFVGFAALLYGIVELSNSVQTGILGITLVISGIGVIIAASLLYIVGNLSEDVHKLTYNVEFLISQNGSYHINMFEHLQEVDRDHDAIKKGIGVISGKIG